MIANIEFDSFPNLPDFYKEKVGFGEYSFYLTQNDEYFLSWVNVCSCCYGDRESVFWILDSSGNLLRKETFEFYQKEIKTMKQYLKFKIPQNIIDKKCLKIKL